MPFRLDQRVTAGSGALRRRRRRCEAEETAVAIDDPEVMAEMASIHRDDFLIKVWEAALILGDQRGVEGGKTIPGHGDFKRRCVARHGLDAIAVAGVAAPVRLSAVEMVVHSAFNGRSARAFFKASR